MTARGRQVFVALVIATVAVAVLGGLIMLGSPGKERERLIDERRVAELRALATAVDLYWTRQGRLPASLAELSHEQGIQVDRSDPATQRPYGYRVLGENAYELCAQFARSDAEVGRLAEDDFWTHGAGPQCFRLEPRAVKR